MTVTTTEAIFRAAATDLDAVAARWALVGGLAFSVRTEPRFTKNVDIAVAATDGAEADDVACRLRSRGYQAGAVTDRTGAVRLERRRSGVIVDLLFASSGIEPEIVAAATPAELSRGFTVPVAATGHLIAMKVLADRDPDRLDLGYLIPAASPAGLEQAREAVRLIKSRGFSRGEDVAANLEFYIKEAGR